MPDEVTPRKWVRIIEDPESDPIDVLRTVGTYKRYLAALEDKAVAAARASGRTWDEIASALGTKRQSAWIKHGPRKQGELGEAKFVLTVTQKPRP